MHGRDQAARREVGHEDAIEVHVTLFISRLAFSRVTERATWLFRRDERVRPDGDDFKLSILIQ